jgi:glycosyltransferase involved in cell wall biosynthesis
MIDELINHGHTVTVCVQDESRNTGPFSIFRRGKILIISIPTGKLIKTSILKKGINTLLLEHRFLMRFLQFEFDSIDVLLYSTPPITFQKVIAKLKKKYNCVTYLLLKDIFPQNAVDLGMLRKNSLLHLFFRYKEKKLYRQSDIIGCMSPGNRKYLLENNRELANKKISITPNCIYPNKQMPDLIKKDVLESYDIPHDTIHLIYGGNIGKPQGIGFLINCISVIKDYGAVSFIIVGDGAEYIKLQKSIGADILNVKLINFLPKEQYLKLLSCMDFGLIFLDNRFTIPNFPSRVLDYMNYSLPIIACTDIVSDIKQEICDQGAGLWCRSDDIEGFKCILDTIIHDKNIGIDMGKRSHQILAEKYSVQNVVVNMLHEINGVKNGKKYSAQ